jgi:hypothetical protein
MQGHGGFQVLDFLAESVGKSSEPAHFYSHGETLTLDKGGKSNTQIKIARHIRFFDANDLGRTLSTRTNGFAGTGIN